MSETRNATCPNCQKFTVNHSCHNHGRVHILRRRFINLVCTGYNKALSRDRRLHACEVLRSIIPDPDRVRAANAESFRHGGPGIWAHTVQHVLWPRVPFTVVEIASKAPCDPSRLRKSFPVKSSSEYLHANLLLALLHHTGFPIDKCPELPTERQWAIAGIAKVSPKIFDVICRQLDFQDARPMVREFSAVPFKAGVVLDCLVSHPDRQVLKKLPSIQPDVCELQNQPDVKRVLAECVEEGNAVLSEYPLLMETLKPISLETEIDDIANSLLYLESWFFARELFFESLEDCGHLLGIFI